MRSRSVPLALVKGQGAGREPGGKDFASAFDHATIGMAIVTPDSRGLRVNRAYCNMLGYAEGEMLGLDVHQITHPHDVARDLHEREELLAGTKETYRCEKRYLHRDGHIVWGDLTCTLVRDDDGHPLHFIAQVIDITERKLAQRQLQDMQSLLHLAAQIGKLGAWAWDCGDATVTWSPEVCAIFDVRPGYAPTREQALAFVAPADRAAMREKLRRCVRDGSPFDAEMRGQTAKGRALWTRVICEAEWDARGRVRRIHGACQDITDSRDASEREREVSERHAGLLHDLNARLEQRVQERTAQLEAAHAELQAFSYSIAHDLRAPLASIDGFSKLLKQSVRPLEGRNAHYLERIRCGVRQMGELTDGLLALASLSRAEVHDDEVDLADFARTAIASCRESEPGRSVDVTIAPALPARGDARLLAQAVGNLVGNAWKFTGQTEYARIDVGCETNPAGAMVYFVRDNGAGFDMAYAARMFEAFQRLHPAGEFDGNGVGLAIVRKIVARHGGRIWAEGAPGRGATLRFTLAPHAAAA